MQQGHFSTALVHTPCGFPGQPMFGLPADVPTWKVDPSVNSKSTFFIGEVLTGAP